MTTVGAVIVNYNARDHLLECLSGVRAEGIDEVVVVDNGSTDGSREAVASADPDVSWVDTGRNLGYGAGANRGARLTGAEAVLLLNPDTLLDPGAVKPMVAVLEADTAVAVVGPRIHEPDGSLYPSARTFPSLTDALGHGFLGLFAPRNRFSRRYKMLDWDHATRRKVDWVSGACMLIRREAFDALGGFDESYFMYAEDVDLCWRAARAGWRAVYEPDASVTHAQGVSADQHPYRMIAAHHRSLFRFAARTSTGARRLLLPVVAVGLAVRTALTAGRRAISSRRPRTARKIRGESTTPRHDEGG